MRGGGRGAIEIYRRTLTFLKLAHVNSVAGVQGLPACDPCDLEIAATGSAAIGAA